jgi:Holliday junction resolvasome RuvABC endonuclease subunit
MVPDGDVAAMIIIGIDPGASGGLAVLVCGDSSEQVIDVATYKMPETERDLLDLLETCAGKNTKAFLEKVHSSPGMGVSSAFTFGRGYGMIRTALVACRIPFDEVTPQRWQKTIGGLAWSGKVVQGFKKRDKNVSKRRAQELFPSVKKVTHAYADAMLIAEHGRRVERGYSGTERT